MTILVTGSAGFIGSNLVERLLTTENSIRIVGLDSVNDYYDVSIKKYRLNRLQQIAVRCPGNVYTFLRETLQTKLLLTDFLLIIILMWWSTLRHRLVYATASPIPMPILKVILSASIIFLRPAVIALTIDKGGCNISCMPLPVPFMAVTKRCHTLLKTG